ncbi:MAG: metallophosphoesterase family protein [Candidatus Thiodiazotropha sp. DIVDIV]
MRDNEILNLGSIQQQVIIFGGPYGNLQATQAMRKVANELNVPPTHTICNGDCIAYCAQPAETVALIQEWGVPVIMGNCEESLAEGRDDCGCGFEDGSSCSVLAETWYPYCNSQLPDGDKLWMGGLPKNIEFTMCDRRFFLFHGGVTTINQFVYASSPATLKQHELELSGADVVVGGHSGLPFGEEVPGGYWLNSGVIGMPANDGTQDGWYLLLTPGETDIRCEWQRLDYDVKSARIAMQNAGLSNGYCAALESGLWPSMDTLPEVERNQQGRVLSIQSMSI